MDIKLRPHFEQFIKEQVDAGHYPSPEAVVEAAILCVIDNTVELTEEDVAAIEKSEEQIARGEYFTSDEVAAKMRQKYGLT